MQFQKFVPIDKSLKPSFAGFEIRIFGPFFSLEFDNIFIEMKSTIFWDLIFDPRNKSIFQLGIGYFSACTYFSFTRFLPSSNVVDWDSKDFRDSCDRHELSLLDKETFYFFIKDLILGPFLDPSTLKTMRPFYDRGFINTILVILSKAFILVRSR